jgi:chromosome segregation ATPase
MASTVQVTLTLDASGVVQEVRAAGESFQRLEQEVDEASESGEQYAQTQRGMAQATDQAAQAADQAKESLTGYEQAVQRLNNIGIQTSQQVRKQISDLRELQAQFDSDSRAAIMLQGEIDQLNASLGRSPQQIKKQINALRDLRRTMQGLDEAGARGEAVERFGISPDAFDNIDRVTDRIERLKATLRDVETPDTQITAMERALRDLNEAGIVTTDQINEQKRELELLQTVFQEDERVVSQLQDQIDRLNQELRKNGAETSDAAAGARTMEDAIDELNNVGIKTTAQLKEQRAQLQRLKEDFTEDARASALLEDRIKQLNRQIQRSDTQVDKFGATTSKSRQFVFSLGDAVQDVQFGIASAGNNIAFMAEQLADMTASAESTGDILNAVTSQIFGAAGLVLGLQALLALGPQLIEMLKNWGSETEEVSERTKELAEGFENFISVVQSQGEETFDLARLQARRLRNEVEDFQEALTDQEVFAGGLDENITAVKSFQDAVNNLFDAMDQGDDSRSIQALNRMSRLVRENSTLRIGLESFGIDVERLADAQGMGGQQAIQYARDLSAQEHVLRNLKEQSQGFIESLNQQIEASREAALQTNFMSQTITDAEDFYESVQTQLGEVNERFDRQAEVLPITEMDRLKSQAELLQSALRSLQLTGIDVQSEEVQKLIDQLGNIRARIQELESERPPVPSTEVDDRFQQRIEQLREMGKIFREAFDQEDIEFDLSTDFPEEAEETAEGVDRIFSSIGRLQNLIDRGAGLTQLEQEARGALRTLRELAASGEISEEQFKMLRSTILLLVPSLRSANSEAQRFAESLGSTLETGIEDAIAAVSSQLGEELALVFDDDQREQLEQRLQSVRQALNRELSRGAAASSDRVRELRNEINSLQDALSEVSPSLGRIGKALLNSLASLAVQIGKLMIGFGVAMSALRPDRLLSNPALAIAAGAALVALGSALRAAVSDRAAQATGGAGGTGRSQLQGGGEAGIEFQEQPVEAAPSRQFGGPVSAGTLFQTHGLGDREFFVPNANGRILTQGQLRAAGSQQQGQSRVLQSSTQGSMSIDISEPDLFEVKARLDELETTLTDLARQ